MNGLKLLLASENPGKLAEFREALPGVRLFGSDDIDLGEFPPEVGTSYDENALIKAGFAAVQAGIPALGDDSGIEIDALDGGPGIHSARFGGDIGDGERIALVLDRLRDRPEAERGAAFKCSLVLALPDGEVRVFHGETRGLILQGPRGRRGFGYDPIFFSSELDKSFAEATQEEKRLVSHRGNAIRQLSAWLKGDEAADLLATWR